VSILFEPQRLGRIEIQNRLIRSATYYGLADPNGRVGDASVELMKTLASNAVGLIVTGFAFVSRSGQVFGDMNGIDRDEQIPGYRRMTDAVHELEGRIVMQIVHAGIVSAMAARRGEPRLVVSAEEGASGPASGTREMTEEDIETIIDAFGQAARRVEEAGFNNVPGDQSLRALPSALRRSCTARRASPARRRFSTWLASIRA
jgi:2,4-dienoyl-CoA reductase-like NADH-dependent reductase (Old Yellow Enzyme family)